MWGRNLTPPSQLQEEQSSSGSIHKRRAKAGRDFCMGSPMANCKNYQETLPRYDHSYKKCSDQFVPIDSLSRGQFTKRWVAGAGAQDQFLDCRRSSSLHFSALPAAGACTPMAPFSPCSGPSVEEEGCLLRWCKAETAQDVSSDSCLQW